jgi:hypothetical protein
VQELTADANRVGSREPLRSMHRRHIAPEGPPDGAHMWIRHVVVATVMRARGADDFRDDARNRLCPRRRFAPLRVDEVAGTEHVAVGCKVQQSDAPIQFVPFPVPVDDAKQPGRHPASDDVAKRNGLVEPMAEPVARACHVDSLAGTVQVPKRTKGISGQPGVEGDLVNPLLRRPALT